MLFPNHDIHRFRGDMYLQNCQYLPALLEYTKATELAPTNALSYINKCCMEYCLDRDYTRLLIALEKFKDIQNLDDRSDYYLHVARALERTKRYEEADVLYKKAIKFSPRTADLYVFRAQLLFRLK